MITLHGFSLSNYVNKVKMVLFEKGIPFQEEPCGLPIKDVGWLESSPLGKVPFIRTEHGDLCESQVIVDYLEAVYPEPPLVPRDSFQAAKVRELVTFVEQHIEMIGRDLYPQAFFGGTCSDSLKDRVRRILNKNIPALKKLAKFDPYIAGADFTMADCAAWVSLPITGMATKLVLGEDLLFAHGLDWKAYAKFIGERPSAQRVTADRKAYELSKA